MNDLDKKKLELLNRINLMQSSDSIKEHSRAILISSIEDEDLKLFLLADIKDGRNRAHIISSFVSDELKLQFLNDPNESELYKYRAVVVCSLDSDDKKIEFLETFPNEEQYAKIIDSINSDDKKLPLIASISDEWHKALVIGSLSSNELKKSLLKEIYTPQNRLIIICSLSDKDMLNELNNFQDDSDKAIIIASLSDDTLKLQLAESLPSDYMPYIISHVSSDQIKLDWLRQNENWLLKSEEGKSLRRNIINSLESDELRIQLYNSLDYDELSIADFIEKPSYLSNIRDESKRINMFLQTNSEIYLQPYVLTSVGSFVEFDYFKQMPDYSREKKIIRAVDSPHRTHRSRFDDDHLTFSMPVQAESISGKDSKIHEILSTLRKLNVSERLLEDLEKELQIIKPSLDLKSVNQSLEERIGEENEQ